MVGHCERDRRDRHLEGHPFFLNGAQFLLEVETAVQTDCCAGLGGGQQVEEPEDVRRRRRHLETVVVPETECAAPVRRGQGDGRVRMADRLGSVRRAGTEDEDGIRAGVDRRAREHLRAGPVQDVPAPRAPSRSRTRVAPRCSASSSVPDPSATAYEGPVSLTAVSTSRAFQAGLSNTGAAPSLLAPTTAATNSGTVRRHDGHPVAGPIPWSARCCATALPARSSSAKVQRSSPGEHGGVIGKTLRSRLEPADA